jgi:hypothetical protein
MGFWRGPRHEAARETIRIRSRPANNLRQPAQLALQVSDPQAAARIGARIERAVVNEAPWVTLGNGESVDFVSKRVGNYQYNPQWGPLFDQMWVR